MIIIVAIIIVFFVDKHPCPGRFYAIDPAVEAVQD
jgi:hypothetical protein